MLCNYCNQNVPIVFQGLADGQKQGEHQHVVVCLGCAMMITNKWAMDKQKQMGRR